MNNIVLPQHILSRINDDRNTIDPQIIAENIWLENLERVKKYIDNYKKRPTDEYDNLGTWIKQQKKNYKRKQDILSKPHFRNKWEDFIIYYSEYFKTDVQIWEEQLEKFKNYIVQYGKLPTRKNSDSQSVELAIWYNQQVIKYKRNRGIMKKNKQVKATWEKFTNEHQNYLKTERDLILDKLEDIKKYVKTTQQLPNRQQLLEYIQKKFEF